MAIQHLSSSVPAPGPAGQSGPIHIPTIWEFCQEAKQEPLYLIKDLLCADANIIMSGRPKLSRKTLFMTAMALCLATGKAVGPMEPVNTAGVPVIVFEQENGAAATARQWEWEARGLGFDLEHTPNLKFFFRRPMVIENSADIDFVVQCVNQTGAKLVVFDSLAMCMRGDENNAQDIGVIGRAFNRIRGAGAGVMFLHHLNKETRSKDGVVTEKDIDQDLRGSSALPGFYDQHFAIRTTSDIEGDPLNMLIRSKNDETKRFRMEWFFDRGRQATSMTMVPSTDPSNLARLEGELSLILAGDDDGVSGKRVQEMLGIDRFTADALVEQMVASSRLTKTGNTLRLVQGGSHGKEADQDPDF